MKRLQILQILWMKNVTYTKKNYIHKIAVVNLSKIYFLENAKKTCKPNKPRFKSWLNNNNDNSNSKSDNNNKNNNNSDNSNNNYNNSSNNNNNNNKLLYC